MGRRDELRILASKMSGAQPVSVSVVGERRIGKSSLLYHFFQTWEQQVNDPTRFVVIYIDLQKANPQTEAEFYQTLADGLQQRLVLRQSKFFASRIGVTQLNKD